MAKEFKLSAERLEELKQELNYLKTVREKEVADQIKEARSFGDLSENSEYDEAKNEQGKLYSRIARWRTSWPTMWSSRSMRPTPIPSAWLQGQGTGSGVRGGGELPGGGSQEADP